MFHACEAIHWENNNFDQEKDGVEKPIEINYECSYGYNDPLFLRYVIEYFDEFIIKKCFKND